MQNKPRFEQLYLNTLFNDQVLRYIIDDCLFDHQEGKKRPYCIENLSMTDLNVENYKTSKMSNSHFEYKNKEDRFHVYQKMMDEMISAYPQTQLSFPRRILLIEVREDCTNQNIGIGICILSKQGLTDHRQDDFVFIQVALQMQKQFEQSAENPIDRFCALIFVVDLPLDHHKNCTVITLGFIDHHKEERKDRTNPCSMRMVISYLNSTNRKWAYIRLLELLWDNKQETDRKVKILQEEFHIDVSKRYVDILHEIDRVYKGSGNN